MGDGLSAIPKISLMVMMPTRKAIQYTITYNTSTAESEVKIGEGTRRVARREREENEKREMAAITAAVIAIAGVVLGWIAIEMACKPCLEKGREAIDRSLNPDYDPDDDIRTPLNQDPLEAPPPPLPSPPPGGIANSKPTNDSATSADAIKTV